MRAGGIGLIFARTRDSELNQGGCDGSYEQHEQSGEAAPSAVVTFTAAVAAEDHGPLSHAGQHGDCARERGGYRTDQDVAVVDVAKLVSKHAFELFVIQ